MAEEKTVYTKVTFGSSNQDEALQSRIWLTGTPKQIVAELGAKGFEVLNKRPSRAKPKAEKAPKAPKAKASKAKKAKEPVAA
jgi:hypothetical protein